MNINTESIDRCMSWWTDRHCYHSAIENVAHHWEIYRYPFFDLRKVTFSDANPKIKKSINQEST